MIKKIGAIVLALVLCLSVVVVPASALDESSYIGYEIVLDKDYYAAGETVVVSLYLHAKEGLEFGTGAIVIGCNSAVFDTAENVANDIKAGSAMSENAVTYYKDGPDVAWAWQSGTVLNNIISNNSAEENAKFDQFLKFAVNKQGSNGSHEFATNTKRGYSSEELNADVEAGIPFMTFELKLRDDIEDGTKIEIGVPEGPMAKNYTYMNYLKSPGTATTLVKTTADNSEVVWVTEAQIGEEPAEFVPLTVSYWKDQIRFDKKADGSYFGTFDYRILATIDNFDEVIGTDYDKVTDVGFIFNKGAAIVEADAKAQVEGGAKTYSQVDNVYVSTAYQGETYVISCLVNNIADADKGTTLSAMAYVEYVVDGVTYYAYSAVQTSTFTTLYNTWYSQAFGA